jgi:hypothetical protein
MYGQAWLSVDRQAVFSDRGLIIHRGMTRDAGTVW